MVSLNQARGSRACVFSIRERIHKVLLEGSEENRLIEKLSKEDYKDFYDYYDGPEGNLSHIDFHDIEDYFGGSND